MPPPLKIGPRAANLAELTRPAELSNRFGVEVLAVVDGDIPVAAGMAGALCTGAAEGDGFDPWQVLERVCDRVREVDFEIV